MWTHRWGQVTPTYPVAPVSAIRIPGPELRGLSAEVVIETRPSRNAAAPQWSQKVTAAYPQSCARCSFAARRYLATVATRADKSLVPPFADSIHPGQRPLEHGLISPI